MYAKKLIERSPIVLTNGIVLSAASLSNQSLITCSNENVIFVVMSDEMEYVGVDYSSKQMNENEYFSLPGDEAR